MRFYRLHRWRDEGESVGYSHYTRRIDAERARRSWLRIGNRKGKYFEAEVDAVDIEPTKRGIIRALRQYASHAPR